MYLVHYQKQLECHQNIFNKELSLNKKMLSSPTRDYNLPIFTAIETITNLTQYELSQKKSDLLKAGLYYSI